MIVDTTTFKMFIDHKCGLVSMSEELHVYDTISNHLLFFRPLKNKITLHNIIGSDKEMNMPVVDMVTPLCEFNSVKDNFDLNNILEFINANNPKLDVKKIQPTYL